MAHDTAKQIYEKIRNSQNVLIACKKNYSADSISSALALFLFLQKLGVSADVACDGFAPGEDLSFLPAIEKIRNSIFGEQRLIISLDLKEAKVDELRYDIMGNVLEISIKPKNRPLSEKNVRSRLASHAYDFIITIDTSDLESLGNFYRLHPTLFQEVPLLNIDHSPENENYGQINLVDISASSCSEIVFGLLNAMPTETAISEDMATCLLAGIFSKTKTFTEDNAGPKTLRIASELAEMGADRNQIVTRLFRNKSLQKINLWGRVLARLKKDDAFRIAWSLVPEYDFIDSRAKKEDMFGVVEEFIQKLPDTRYVLLFCQSGKNTEVYCFGKNFYDVSQILKKYKTEGGKNFAFFVLENTPIIDAEKEVLENARKEIRKTG